jgi:hypothetical protein
MSEAPPPPEEAGPDELEDAETDAVLGLLGQREREREAALVDARAPEWEAVVSGQLSVDEAIAARGEAGDEQEQLEQAAAYFRPFDADERAGLLDALLGEAQAEAPSNVVPLVERAVTDQAGQTEQAGRGAGWISGGLLLVAAAAAIVLWWVWPVNPNGLGGDEGTTLTQREPLPSYVLETDGGLSQLRGDTGDEPAQAPNRYRGDTPFEWVLRPEASVDGTVGVRGFAFVDGGTAGRPLQLDPLVRIASSGAIQITGTIHQLGLEAGSYTIALVVGRPDDLPARAADAVAPTREGVSSPWELGRVDIVIVE